MTVEIAMEDARWEAAGLEAIAGRAVSAALAHLGTVPGAWELAILACDDARIAGLNADFRGKPRATNVLSWPAQDLAPAAPGARPPAPVPDLHGEPLFLGDVALAWETCVAEAEAGGRPLADHLSHLVVHAVLHLLGYAHETEADAARMEGEEARILDRLGVANPY